jgi:hypothetical protein
MTIGNCGEIVEDPQNPDSFVGIAKPAEVPQPEGDGWNLVTAVPLGSDFIQYIWQKEL